MNINYYDNSLISLEEEDSRQQKKTNKKRNNYYLYKDSTSDSFFGKLINSVSKIGQGLKNIMSMKINFENDDNNNDQNFYEQISNRFNTYEEISLIDAPSFMEDSHSFIKYTKKTEKNINSNEDKNKNNISSFIDNDNINEEDNQMIISHNETKRDESIIKNNNIKEEIINTDIINDNDNSDIMIKTSLLNKKRANDLKFEKLLSEEENIEKKNEDEEKKSNKRQSFIKTEKSFYSNKSNNKREKKNMLNTSIMSLSMKSLDNIKDEINQRREQNLRSIEEMHRRHELNYDYIKEREIREKILEEYYKEKEKRIEESRLQLEREKRKREEEFQKLKVRKANCLKYTSIPKKPKILSKMKIPDIQFFGMPNQIKSSLGGDKSIPNTLNLTFGENNNTIEQSRTQTNERNAINKDNKIKPMENEIKNVDNKTKSIFGDYNNKKDEDNKKDIKQNTETNEKPKNETPLFSGPPLGNLFNAPSTSTIGSAAPLFSNLTNPENKKEQKDNFINEKAKEPQQQQQQNNNPLFGPTSIFSGGNNVESIFKVNPDNDKKSASIFFGNNPIKANNDNNKEQFGLFNFKKEEGIFNQQSSVSKSMNDKTLLTSNQSKDQGQKSLADKNTNPFLQKANNNPIPSLFGNNPQGTGQTPSLFGSSTGRGLFG